MSIGKKVKNRRSELNLTQEDLAQKLNVARTTISNWETERNYPDIQMIVNLSEILDISLDTLLKDDVKVVKKIAEDTHIRKKQNIKILVLTFIILLLLSTVGYLGYQKIKVNDISLESQIENIKDEKDDVLIDLNLPFYRSIDGYFINLAPNDDNVLEITLSSRIDLTMSNNNRFIFDKDDLYRMNSKVNKIIITNSEGKILRSLSINN